MSDNIPYEIQLEIIKKVPDVKSLIRLRSVSKQWKSFIDNSEFITGYGARSTQPHHLLLRYQEAGDSREVKYVSFVYDVSFPQQQLDFSPNVSDLVKQLYKSTVIGSSCGLWCLRGYDTSETEMVVIWNPSIRKSVGIVVLKNTSGIFTHFGFGVCPLTYDPTIVKMLYSFEGKDTVKWQVEIFSLSSKTWKMILSSNLPRKSVSVFRFSTQVAIDRFIYWVAYDKSSFKKLILSFDLITLEFKEVNLPISIANQVASDISISKLNESLVVSAIADEVNDGLVYGIWMMEEEGGIMTSFTKLFNVQTPFDSPLSKVLGFLMSGEPILETEKGYGEFAKAEVYKYSEHINDFGITGVNGSFFVCPYTETLLLTDHSDGYIISNNY